MASTDQLDEAINELDEMFHDLKTLQRRHSERSVHGNNDVSVTPSKVSSAARARETSTSRSSFQSSPDNNNKRRIDVRRHDLNSADVIKKAKTTPVKEVKFQLSKSYRGRYESNSYNPARRIFSDPTLEPIHGTLSRQFATVGFRPSISGSNRKRITSDLDFPFSSNLQRYPSSLQSHTSIHYPNFPTLSPPESIYDDVPEELNDVLAAFDDVIPDYDTISDYDEIPDTPPEDNDVDKNSNAAAKDDARSRYGTRSSLDSRSRYGTRSSLDVTSSFDARPSFDARSSFDSRSSEDGRSHYDAEGTLRFSKGLAQGSQRNRKIEYTDVQIKNSKPVMVVGMRKVDHQTPIETETNQTSSKAGIINQSYISDSPIAMGGKQVTTQSETRFNDEGQNGIVQRASTPSVGPPEVPTPVGSMIIIDHAAKHNQETRCRPTCRCHFAMVLLSTFALVLFLFAFVAFIYIGVINEREISRNLFFSQSTSRIVVTNGT